MVYTVRGLPKSVTRRVAAYAKQAGLKTGEAMGVLLLQALTAEERKPRRKYRLADLDKIAFSGGPKDASMRVDEILYGIKRPRRS